MNDSTNNHRDDPQLTDDGKDAANASGSEPESFLVPIAQHITPASIFSWLRAGWRDFVACFPRSAVFGVCFAAMGLILMWVFNNAPAYLMALISGFLLAGPFVCTGCYELSRQIHRGEPLQLKLALCAFRSCKKNIAIFAALLLVLELLWGRASLIVFAAFYQGALPDSKDVLKAFLTLQNVPFVIAYMLVGAIFATLVMIASVISIPMMMDRRTDAITAALTSVRVCLRHPISLTLWGLTITALTVLAMLPYFLGLIVVGPWLGHASWHAYRALVPPTQRAVAPDECELSPATIMPTPESSRSALQGETSAQVDAHASVSEATNLVVHERAARGAFWPFGVIAVVLCVGMLKWAGDFFVPLVAGIFLSYSLAPAVNALENLRVPRALGAAIAVLAFVALLAMVSAAVWNQAVAMAESLPTSVNRIAEQMKRVVSDRRSSLKKIDEAAKAVSTVIDSPTDLPSSRETAAASVRKGQANAPVAPVVVARASVVNEFLKQGSKSVAVFIGSLSTVLLLAYFLLTAGDAFRRKLIRVTGTRLSEKRLTVQVLDSIHLAVQNYLGSLLVSNVALGLATYLALLLLGFDDAAVWGVLSGVLHVIPYVGPIITAIGVFITGFQQWDNFLDPAIAAGATVIVAIAVGVFLQTWMMGRSAKMNSSALFVALLFFSWLWGAVGMLIAIPLAVVVKVVCDHIDELKPVSEFLSA